MNETNTRLAEEWAPNVTTERENDLDLEHVQRVPGSPMFESNNALDYMVGPWIARTVSMYMNDAWCASDWRLAKLVFEAFFRLGARWFQKRSVRIPADSGFWMRTEPQEKSLFDEACNFARRMAHKYGWTVIE